ncbi:MAG: sugar ABC transporter permease [Verrucomicrobiota bacterium JB022]|nr:sugar ABC transporter permease [Verrucomicrobiota bacterium JB022]
MRPHLSKDSAAVLRGLAFISPNILGFLLFTLVPLVLSFVMAFTNWDLLQHNMFQDNPIQFVGLRNFIQLFQDTNFWQYLGNTFFLLLGIPFSIAGSLGAALLLFRNPKEGYRGPGWLFWSVGLSVSSGLLLLALGFGASAIVSVLAGLFALVMISGMAGGTTVYRTLFYLPHFTQGVAIFILWKKLYNPTSGPINSTLSPVLDAVGGVAAQFPPQAGYVALALVAALMLWVWSAALRGSLVAWREGEQGTAALVAALVALLVPLFFALRWLPGPTGIVFVAAAVALGVWRGRRVWARYPFRHAAPKAHGMGAALMKGGAVVALLLALIGIGQVLLHLPVWSRSGLEPPLWLADYHWAKPSIMIMSLWASIGSNSMILYLAGLSNISPELYEAADIDGAGRWQKFHHITWPQLAPVTFFIVIMSFIYGLQGGFEMARTMTKGGPAGATTTLSYYVYTEGFETGRLGYASAVAWVLFLMVFLITLFNWKFGNRYVAD